MAKREIVGLVEKVVLVGKTKSAALYARIDTGATKSSVDKALVNALNLGPIIRSKKVKNVLGSVLRPIIKAKVNIAGKIREEEFTIADRRHMKYQLLIGQNILKKERFLIDPLKGKR